MKNCASCNLLKELTDFGNNKTLPSGKAVYCKECCSKIQKKHYAEHPNRRIQIEESRIKQRNRNIKFILSYFKKHFCIDCGESDPVVLDFDHRGDKKYSISHLLAKASLEKIEKEISKCDVRCANCHRKKTAKQFGWTKFALANEK